MTNQDERILTMLMMGFSYSDLHMHVKNKSISGISPDLTIHGLEKYKNKYGVTPTLITLSNPRNFDESVGLKDEIERTHNVGDRVEIDVMEYEFNMSRKSTEKKSKKLPTFGGAIAAAVCVDVDSGKIFGTLLQTTANSVDYVREFHQQFKMAGHTWKSMAADSGVLIQSTFKVYSTEVEKYLKANNIRSILSEPERHKNGTAVIEIVIKLIKQLMNLAFKYIEANPNFHLLPFTMDQVHRLWG